ncbi:hypothetical protein JB92DRAFT_2810514 [Gautieria morchelliformis]|nr:hypothetical protein JB92DRAFT_2810514 [Gautieria morchelliformis]
MMLSQLPLLVVALGFIALPSVEAALFPKKSNVTHIDHKAFRNALKGERAFVTAFVAPWCGHCQKLAPELMRAADGLHPLVPVYAVDCDDDQNKLLCAEQNVKGFPTIKLFSGSETPPADFDGTRSASSLFYWASGHVPMKLTRTQTAKGIAEIVAKNPGKPKAVLMNKSNKMPLLWKVLSNKYGKDIVFVNCRDRQGKVSVEMGFEAEPQSKHKVIVYGRDDAEPVLYEGILKFAAVSDFFDQVLEGSIDISRASLDAKQEILKVPDSERGSLSDETRMDESGYGGFNPHDGADMEELIRKYGNPHAAGHPGAPNPHQGGKAGAKAAGDPTESGAESSASKAESSSSKADPSSSEPLSSAQAESTVSEDQSSQKGTETSATHTAEHTSADPAQGTEPVVEHPKDEL